MNTKKSKTNTIARAPSYVALGEYFQEKLRERCEELDPGFLNMSLSSPCGRECKEVIDAAATLLRHHRTAYGPSRPSVEQSIINSATLICCTYYFG